MLARPTVLACVACSFLSPLAGHAQENRPGISGVVRDDAGAPVAGATVYVWTAGVKVGYSTFCPGCYADCGKHDAADEQGHFQIDSLDPELTFKLLAVAEGHQPTFVPRVDPAKGEAIAIALPRRAAEPADSLRVLRGRIVDAEGEPIATAAVEAEMVMWRDEQGQLTGRGGAVEGLDPVAITNEQGEFVLTYKDPTVTWTIEVEARGFARRIIPDLAAGATIHEIQLQRGSAIVGRLVHDGKPVPGAQVGIAHTDRIFPNWLGEETIGTDADGRFVFVNVPAGTEWAVYGTMNSVRHLGGTDASVIRTGADETETDVGDVTITPAFRLSGRVVLEDGEPIPPGMRIFISRDSARDSQSADLPADGSFHFAGLPRDGYSIGASIKGYRHSRANPRLAWSIEGLIDRDIDGFVILMEPGQEDFNGLSAGKFKGVPLQGASVKDR